MQRETASTTASSDRVIDAIAQDVETVPQATPADVRGNVEVDASFASFSFIKDLGETPAYANQHTDKAFLAEVGSYAAIPVAAMPGENKEPAVSKAPARRETKPPTREIQRSVRETETEEPKTTRIGRMLGRIALAPAHAARSAKTMYYSGLATAVGALPGTKSKEEFRELVHEQREKYADKPGDGFFARKWNAVRRKKYEALAWTPVAAMGLAAFELYAMRTVGYFHAADGLSVQPQTRDWNNAIVVNPLPPVETHNTTPPQAAAAIETPAPKPAPAETPIATRKPIWKPIPEAVPGPSPVEKVMPHGGKEIVIPIGGATDPDGNIPADMLDPNKVRVERIWYPAEMGPFVGTTPTNVSVDQGIDTVVNRVVELRKQNPNAVINLNGFSEGSFVARGAARRLQDMGIAVNVQTAGDPNTAVGILDNPLAQMAKPMTEAMGIHEAPEIKGLRSKVDGADAWGSTATKDPGSILGNFMDMSKHRIPNEGEVPVQILTDGIETTEVYGQPILILPAGVTDITPGGPVAAASVPAPMPEAPGPVPEVPAPIGQPLPPAAEPERLSTPSFFGEQPCVAPDGSEYYTPGNAPCAA